MATWDKLGSDNLAAAKVLLDAGHVRSAVSRAYYAAYATVTARLLEAGHGVGIAGRPNPSHEQVASMARHNLDPRRFGEQTRKEIAGKVRLLLRLRVAADYDPESAMEREDGIVGLRAASVIQERLGASDGRG